MSNVLSDHKQQQVLALGRLGWSLRRIQAATGIRRETASAYLRAAGIPVRGVGGRPKVWPPPPVPATTPPKPATTAEVSTDFTPSPGPEATVPPPGRAPSASACEPYRELIADAVRRGRHAMAIWQELVDDHGFPARYASVRRFVATLRAPIQQEPHAVITTAPGEEGQVDYGEGPMVRETPGGKYRRSRLFVLTLGCSRKSVRLLTWRSSTQIWCELHEQAFRRLGGTVRVIVLDNLCGRPCVSMMARSGSTAMDGHLAASEITASSSMADRGKDSRPTSRDIPKTVLRLWYSLISPGSETPPV